MPDDQGALEHAILNPPADALEALLLAMDGDVAGFRFGYDSQRPLGGSAPSFASYRALAQGAGVGADRDRAAMRAAAERARQDHFLSNIIFLLLRQLHEENAPPIRQRLIAHAVASLTGGEHHAITDAARGLGDVVLLMKLVRAAQATCVIIGDNQTPEGTGFLVGPDLVLTSAHVLWKAAPRMVNGVRDVSMVRIEFHNQLDAQGAWPRKAFLAPQNWDVAHSGPCGTPPGMTPLAHAANAASLLDFQLLRLAEPLGEELPIINIAQPPRPTATGVRVHIVGYPGGTQCKYDANPITDLRANEGRLFHDVNTIAGMSGSPCIDNQGAAVALHEGSETANPRMLNRAVLLHAVRTAMQTPGPDPMTQGRAWPAWITSQDARRAWARAGLSLSGADANDWRAGLSELGDPDPESGELPKDPAHPYFRRAGLEAWLSQSLIRAARSRVLAVSGPVGSGKSFTTSVLRHWLSKSLEDLATLTPTMAHAVTWNEVLTSFGAAGLSGLNEALRPTDSVLTRDIYPGMFARLAQRNRGETDRSEQPFYLAVDCGDMSAWRNYEEHWRLLVASAMQHPAMRVLVMGLGPTQADALAMMLTGVTVVDQDRLDYVHDNDFAEQLNLARSSLGAASFADDDAAAAAEVIRKAKNTLAESIAQNPALKTVQAVRISLALRAAALKQTPNGEGGAP